MLTVGVTAVTQQVQVPSTGGATNATESINVPSNIQAVPGQLPIGAITSPLLPNQAATVSPKDSHGNDVVAVSQQVGHDNVSGREYDVTRPIEQTTMIANQGQSQIVAGQHDSEAKG